MPTYTPAVTVLAVLFYFFLSTRVSAARRKFGVPLPAMAGHPDFERVVRVHLNTLEWMPIFLPFLWLCALYFSDRAAAIGGLAWIVGRALYLVGYSKAVDKRLPGFLVQTLACLFLLGSASTGIVMRMVN